MTQLLAEQREEDEAFPNEVFVLPGRCVAWSARIGHCPNTTGSLACDEHAREFERETTKPFYLTDEEFAQRESMTPTDWRNFCKRLYMRRKRAVGCNPATLERMRLADIGRQERREMILGELAQHGFVSTADIRARFGVSEDTVKTQLREMADEGVLERVYGGAKRPGFEVRGGQLRRPRGESQRTIKNFHSES